MGECIMGLLDKAKEIQKTEEVEAPAAAEEKNIEETGETVPSEKLEEKKEKKEKAAPEKKKASEKKKTGKPSGKKKKPAAKGKKPSMSLKAPSLPKSKKPKKKKEVPEEPPIEGLPEDLAFAPVVNRMLAQVFDGIILLVIVFILFIGIVMGSGGEMVGVLIGFLLYLIIPIGYFYYFLGMKDGVTLGKSYFHVKVVSLDGRKLTPKRVQGTVIWNGLLYPILNIVDAILGIFILHKDTQQRLSQEKDDLIVITVKKKKKAFYGALNGEEGESEEEGTEEEDAMDTETGIEKHDEETTGVASKGAE